MLSKGNHVNVYFIQQIVEEVEAKLNGALHTDALLDIAEEAKLVLNEHRKDYGLPN